jgi:DNA-binding MarR family transcriptional regulator
MVSKQKTVDEIALCNATAMRKASRRMTQLYDDALEHTGMRSTQFAILAHLYGRSKEPPTMAELAAVLVMDRSSLGHNLRPLERDGLIGLQEGSEDRRCRHIVLTAQGLSKLKECRECWLTAQERFNAVVGKSEAALLRERLLGIAYDERLGALKS